MFSTHISRKFPITVIKRILSVTAQYGSKVMPDEFNNQQASYYTAKDIEFCPNRAREVMQNHVQSSQEADTCVEEKMFEAPVSDRDQMEAYQSGNSVSLYSVMQSNVPEPFNAKDKAPTHLNMPGSSSSLECKYLSGKMQGTHQSNQ